MKKALISLVSFPIGFFFFFLVIKWVGWAEIKEALFSFSGLNGVIVLCLTLLIWITGALKWKFILKSQGHDLPLPSLTEMMLAGFSISYLFSLAAFWGGMGFKAYAVRKRFGVPLEKNLASIAIEKVLDLTVIFLFLILGAISFLFLAPANLRSLSVTALFIIICLALILAIFYFKTHNKKSILKWLLRFSGIKNNKSGQIIKNIEEEIFLFFNFRRTLIWKGFGIAFVRYIIIFSRCWLIILFLGAGWNIWYALAVMFFIKVRISSFNFFLYLSNSSVNFILLSLAFNNCCIFFSGYNLSGRAKFIYFNIFKF